mgnify:CR=1 FL=1
MIVANYIAFIILLIGALNWGLIALFGFNLVEFICMGNKMLARIIYVLVLIAAIWLIIATILDGGILFKTIATTPRP